MHSDFIPAEISLQYEPEGEQITSNGLNISGEKLLSLFAQLEEKTKELRITHQKVPSFNLVKVDIEQREKRKNLA